MEHSEKQAKNLYEIGCTQDAAAVECGVEYTLPDYMPEIRKLLRVDARAIPSGRYLGEESAEFSGIVAFTVLYSDGEGRLSGILQNGEYTLVCRTKEPIRDAFLDVEVEGAACRLYGPRKIGLRATVRGRAELLSDAALPSYPEEGLEMLSTAREVRSTRVLGGTEIAFSDSIAALGTSPDALRLLSCDGAILFEDTRIQQDAVRLRGAAEVRILAATEDGRPLSYTARIPLECELPAEGVCAQDLCLPYGCISSLNVRPTGDGEGGCRLELDGVAECGVRLYANRKITVVEDLYSPGHRSEREVRALPLERVLAATYGSYTVSGSTSFPVGEECANHIPNATATAVIRKISTEGGHPVVSGDVRVRLLLAGAPSGEDGRVCCSAAEISHPFRIEAALTVPEGKDVRYAAAVTPLSVRPRIEDNGYGADTELSLSMVVTCGESVRVVESVTLHEEERPLHEEDRIRVIYPAGEDTLWSLAERAATTPRALAEANRLPYTDNAEAALPTSLDGVQYLLVE